MFKTGEQITTSSQNYFYLPKKKAIFVILLKVLRKNIMKDNNNLQFK